MISNEKYLNYKVVDIIKIYHFSYKNISIGVHMKCVGDSPRGPLKQRGILT
jgi:hypothetical protein